MVQIKEYTAPPINKKEICRYAGEREMSNRFLSLVDECLSEISDKLSYKVAFCEVGVSIDGEDIDLGFVKVRSVSLAKNLSGCKTAVIFAATVGLMPDRLISRYGVSSPSKALVFDAIGAERIESLCDVFCEELKEISTRRLRPRFSAGYGDLPIEMQTDIFRLLDCPKNIGLTLGESLLMSPSKSVTAIIGIG